jgi:hypothetical protein
MAQAIKAYPLDPEQFECPMCQAAFVGATPVDGVPRGFKKGLLTICAHCGEMIIMGDEKFAPLSKAQFDALPEVTRRKLRLVQEIIARQIDERTDDEIE